MASKRPSVFDKDPEKLGREIRAENRKRKEEKLAAEAAAAAATTTTANPIASSSSSVYQSTSAHLRPSLIGTFVRQRYSSAPAGRAVPRAPAPRPLTPPVLFSDQFRQPPYNPYFESPTIQASPPEFEGEQEEEEDSESERTPPEGKEKETLDTSEEDVVEEEVEEEEEDVELFNPVIPVVPHTPPPFDQTTLRCSTTSTASPLQTFFKQLFPTMPKDAEPGSSRDVNVIVNSAVYIPGLIFDGGKNFASFLEQFETMSTLNNWSEGMKLGNLLLHIKGSALDCYKNYLLAEAQKKGLTLDELKAKHTPSYADVIKLFKDAFEHTESVESIEKRLNQIKRKNYDSASEYFFAKMHLINRLDSSMSDQRKIGFLIKGLPKTSAESIFMQSPVTPDDVLNLLKQQEKFQNLISDSESANIIVEEVRNVFSKLFDEKKEEINILAKTSTSNTDGRKNNKEVRKGKQRQNTFSNRGRNQSYPSYNHRGNHRGGRNQFREPIHININTPPAYRGKNSSRGNYSQNRQSSSIHVRNEMVCYNCGEQGHIAPQCNSPIKVCYHCREENHLARSCPYKNK